MLKRRPFWLFWLPANFWITISPNIYYPKGIDTNKYPNVIAHESVHLRQQSVGKYRWILKYIFSKKFRLAMEVEAMAQEIIYDQVHYNDNYAQTTLDNYGTLLSNWNYLWAAPSKQQAIDAINAEITKAKEKANIVEETHATFI